MKNLILFLFLLFGIFGIIRAQSILDDFDCGMDSLPVNQPPQNIQSCSSEGVFNPSVSELNEFTLDEYTPIKTINVRLVFFHYSANDPRNFEINNPAHVNHLHNLFSYLNSSMNSLYGNLKAVDPSLQSICANETNLPPGSALTEDTDSRIRFRIHDMVEIDDQYV